MLIDGKCGEKNSVRRLMKKKERRYLKKNFSIMTILDETRKKERKNAENRMCSTFYQKIEGEYFFTKFVSHVSFYIHIFFFFHLPSIWTILSFPFSYVLYIHRVHVVGIGEKKG